MEKLTFKHLFTMIVILTTSAACENAGIGGGKACTEIGCDDGVTVRISDERPDSLTATLYLDNETEASGTTNCSGRDESCYIRIGGKTPETVTVVIEWDGEEYRETFSPDYENLRPNGPGCPPVCTMATIDVDLSGL